MRLSLASPWPSRSSQHHPTSNLLGLPLEGEEAERFLATAQIIRMKPVGVGITNSYKVYLANGNRTIKAIWKTVDEHRQELSRSERGSFQFGFRDSYKYEIAAYELDKLLGLGLVPPTVERTIDNQTGSLQLWVEGAFTEFERRKKQLLPKDGWRWGAQMYKVNLLNQLIYNTDTKNVLNILFDPDFRVYAIDHSRSSVSIRSFPRPKSSADSHARLSINFANGIGSERKAVSGAGSRVVRYPLCLRGVTYSRRTSIVW